MEPFDDELLVALPEFYQVDDPLRLLEDLAASQHRRVLHRVLVASVLVKSRAWELHRWVWLPDVTLLQVHCCLHARGLFVVERGQTLVYIPQVHGCWTRAKTRPCIVVSLLEASVEEHLEVWSEG